MQSNDNNTNRQYVILYKQPTLGPPKPYGKKRDLIWKEAEENIEAIDDTEALKQTHLFMEEGVVWLGALAYQRKFTKLVKFLPFRVVSDFLPGSNHPSRQLSA